MISIGALSDTHLLQPNDLFRDMVTACFAETEIILHAGDLTHFSILEAFAGKQIHAVHGNMCSSETCTVLPEKKIIEISGKKIGLIHRAGVSYDFEDYLLDEFEEVDCIVYGHTHQASCRRAGHVLLVNPGQFMPFGRHGAGTYAIITIQDRHITARILESRLPR